MEASAPKEATAKAPVTFPCSGCGGPMLFDSEAQNLKCQYCGREEAIEDSGSQPVEYDLDLSGTDEENAARTDWGFRKQTLHCESCGGDIVLPELETAAICPFCGSSKVLSQQDTASIKPETVIPFQISMEQAMASFKTWKSKRWFVPNAFKNGNIVARLSGLYIPYWTFDADTDSVYTAERGDYHYRTVTRTRTVNGKTETYTTQERYTVWHRVGGEYDRWFDDVLVPASRRYDGKLLEKLNNFDLSKLKEYRPEYLSGYLAEKYSVPRSEGWQQAKVRIDNAIEVGIKRQIGGDEIRALRTRTQYSGLTYKHLLLPIWNAGYTYRGKSYRYMVNAQTGLVSGTVPRSPWKITIFVLFCVAAVLIVLYFIGQSQ